MIKRGINVNSSKEEEGGEKESSHHSMEIKCQFVTEELPPHIEETHEEPSAQAHQLQEGHLIQEGPPAWFFEYFGKLNATMERMKQGQQQQEKYIEWLGDFYEKMYEQQIDFNQQYNERMTSIESQLEYLWFSTHPTSLPSDFPPPPPSSSHDASSSAYQPLLF
ncbi:hypothetical protein Acr_20g0007240 [Actinidia rufa]|uniref:Uncharacterized protein n=1 Tax=Actinidia rufa TaxID=165716 RepID=A0A7J0GDK8_9ERIC|nr:hypothetical protein Acr_20g0007240 [Actinidia rufa]